MCWMPLHMSCLPAHNYLYDVKLDIYAAAAARRKKLGNRSLGSVPGNWIFWHLSWLLQLLPPVLWIADLRPCTAWAVGPAGACTTLSGSRLIQETAALQWQEVSGLSVSIEERGYRRNLYRYIYYSLDFKIITERIFLFCDVFFSGSTWPRLSPSCIRINHWERVQWRGRGNLRCSPGAGCRQTLNRERLIKIRIWSECFQDILS